MTDHKSRSLASERAARFIHYSDVFSSSGCALISCISVTKTNEIRELEWCEKANAKESAQLSKTCEKETNSKSFDAISEQLFFDAAAREQIKAYDCVEK